jgi:hypothetical protein
MTISSKQNSISDTPHVSNRVGSIRTTDALSYSTILSGAEKRLVNLAHTLGEAIDLYGINKINWPDDFRKQYETQFDEHFSKSKIEFNLLNDASLIC